VQQQQQHTPRRQDSKELERERERDSSHLLHNYPDSILKHGNRYGFARIKWVQKLYNVQFSQILKRQRRLLEQVYTNYFIVPLIPYDHLPKLVQQTKTKS
jgi:hypothetical protein